LDLRTFAPVLTVFPTKIFLNIIKDMIYRKN